MKLNTYIAYIININNGTSRDASIYAEDSFMARRICEDCCLSRNEKIKCLYPENSTQKEIL